MHNKNPKDTVDTTMNTKLTQKLHKTQYLALVLFAILALTISRTYILKKIGLFLVSETPNIPSADAIIILSGDSGNRVKKGVALYKRKKAPLLIFTGEPVMNTSMPKIMSEYAEQMGVPTKNILLEENSTSTHEHPKNCATLMKEKNIQSIIVVTSYYHTQRTQSVFKKYFKNTKIKVTIVGAEDGITYKTWWQHENMREKILMELAKTAWYWLRY